MRTGQCLALTAGSLSRVGLFGLSWHRKACPHDSGSIQKTSMDRSKSLLELLPKQTCKILKALGSLHFLFPCAHAVVAPNIYTQDPTQALLPLHGLCPMLLGLLSRPTPSSPDGKSWKIGLWEPDGDLSHPPRCCCSHPALGPQCQDTPRLSGAEKVPGHPMSLHGLSWQW